ncbi:MAG: hypothetical protein ABI660_04500 [Polaromonas sp.]
MSHKAATFQAFVVRTFETTLRGRTYRILADGHHNLAAAQQAGLEPTWRGPNKKLQRVIDTTPKSAFERFLINNLTDSDWYYVDTGEPVRELMGVEKVGAA